MFQVWLFESVSSLKVHFHTTNNQISAIIKPKFYPLPKRLYLNLFSLGLIVPSLNANKLRGVSQFSQELNPI
ncbi:MULTISPECIES: hypothetical protein [Helicobacter]|uniref:hypothetical protein n=1 Tax=Helicobacter TaxID=209 RepID=UPI00262FA0F7|nr:hypothetical protein [Helicobacter sp. UBA3407]